MDYLDISIGKILGWVPYQSNIVIQFISLNRFYYNVFILKIHFLQNVLTYKKFIKMCQKKILASLNMKDWYWIIIVL